MRVSKRRMFTSMSTARRLYSPIMATLGLALALAALIIALSNTSGHPSRMSWHTVPGLRGVHQGPMIPYTGPGPVRVPQRGAASGNQRGGEAGYGARPTGTTTAPATAPGTIMKVSPVRRPYTVTMTTGSPTPSTAPAQPAAN